MALRSAVLAVVATSAVGWAEEATPPQPPPGYPPPPVQPPMNPAPGYPPQAQPAPYPPVYPAPYPPPANPYINPAPLRPVVHVAPYQLPPPWIKPRRFVRGTFGAGGFGSLVAGQTNPIEYLSHGGGLLLWGGVEIGRIFEIDGRFTSSFHNPVNSCFAGVVYVWCDANYLLLNSFGIDLKIHIPTNTRVVPYGIVGPMVAWLGRQAALADATGGGFEAGGGLDVWFSRNSTIGFEVLYRGVVMSDFANIPRTETYLSLVQIGGTIAAHFQ